MINEIYPHIYNNEYKNIEPKNDDILLIYNNDNILLKEDNFNIEFPKFTDIKNGKYIFLFSIDESNYFLYNDKSVEEFNDFKYYPISLLRKSSPDYLSFAGITGYQLYQWYGKNKFCGNCGSKMFHSKDSRSMICHACGDIRYPFLAPAVIVGIIDVDKILVTKYKGREYRNYALVAGYAEIGEDIEDTVRREVMEEVGLKVKNITYYKSQPWSFSGSLLFGFFCQLDGSNKITLDKEELSMAKWIKADEIQEDNIQIALTAEMMQIFKNRKITIKD